MRTGGFMLRVRLIVAASVVALAPALAGCSSSLPDWMSFKSSPPPPTALQFESDPPGADVRTAQGQTCLTPCSLTVPPENQSVSFAKNGYLPQTVQVTVRMPEHGMFDNPPPDIQPNPVAVVLQPAPPPHKLAPRPKPRPHKTAARAGAPPPPPPGGSPFPPPPGQ
jgi:PEGA domain-containing protein